MNLYQPSGRNGILLKSLFPYLHSFAAIRKIVGATSLYGVLDKEILSVAQKAFGVNNIEYSIFGGTPSVHQKITIQFFQGNRILGYGKVADSVCIANLFVHEQELLAYLTAKGARYIPKCLVCSQLQSKRYIFLQTTTKTSKSVSPNEWTSLHETFLNNLEQKTTVKLPFHETDYYKTLTCLMEFLPTIPAGQKEIIATAIDLTQREFNRSLCSFSAYHADFTPWNMFISGKNLFVFDWEYGGKTYPTKLDKYHFFVQQYIHVEHMSATDIYNRIIDFEWYDTRTFRCYLLDVISRFVCRENGHISNDLGKMLGIWTSILQIIE
jgi:hypothetical protein